MDNIFKRIDAEIIKKAFQKFQEVAAYETKLKCITHIDGGYWDIDYEMWKKNGLQEKFNGIIRISNEKIVTLKAYSAFLEKDLNKIWKDVLKEEFPFLKNEIERKEIVKERAEAMKEIAKLNKERADLLLKVQILDAKLERLDENANENGEEKIF